MDLTVELFMIFYTAIIFTILLVLFGRELRTKIVFGLLSFLSWVVFAIVYNASTPTYPIVAFLFFGIALTVMIATVHDTVQTLKGETV